MKGLISDGTLPCCNFSEVMWVYVWMWELVCNVLKEILGVGDTCGRSVVLVGKG